MKYVTCKINEIEMNMLYSVGAMFELRPLYESEEKIKYIDDDGDECERHASLIDVIDSPTVTGIENLFKTAAVMAEQGELYRRYAGHDPKKIISYEELYEIVKPDKYYEFKEAVFTAIVLGHSREIAEENIDLAAEEYARQKSERPGLSTYFAVGSALGMSQKDILFERPGMLEDVLAIKNKGKQKPAPSEGEDY